MMDAPFTSLDFWIGTAIIMLDLGIVLLLVPKILLQQRESGATLAWILLIVLLPFLGLLAFWILGTTRLNLRRRRRRRSESRLAPQLHPLTSEITVEARQGADTPPVRPELLALARRLDASGPLSGNRVTLYRDGDHCFDAIIAAMEAARHHLHLLYYTWKPDRTGTRLRDALIRAVRRGVEVRVLVDDVGSRTTRPAFFAPLLAVGGRVERFLPVNIFSRQLALNFRNHRKVVVVDGSAAFTGGMNVGDEYAGLATPWRDAHVEVGGPAVVQLQEIFAQDWYHAAGEDLAMPDYFPQVDPLGEAWVQFLASGPADLRWRSIHTLLFSALNLARERIWIETPYFVPDQAMLMSLQTAALRGVDVRLVLPGNSDHPLVLHAGRSFYTELLEAGVRIFELPQHMLHAKTTTVDGCFSTVGSANLDRRSFRLNFEANAFFYGPIMANALEVSFQAIQAEATPVTLPELRRRPYRTRLLAATARTLAPLL